MSKMKDVQIAGANAGLPGYQPEGPAPATLKIPTGGSGGTSQAAGLSVTEQSLAAAFTEWDRRYREEPERFMSEAQHLLKETPETYGAACAPYLIALLTGKL